MAALPIKLKNLLTRQKDKSSSNEFDHVNLTPSKSVIESSPQHEDERVDEIISSIDPIYLSDDQAADTVSFELQSIGDDGDIDMDKLMDRILLLKKADGAVYRKIYDLVFANYTAYVQELENVTALELSLREASYTCVSARRHLRMAKEGVSNGGLGLLAKQRKRKRLLVLLGILKTFKTLQKAETTLKELLNEGDYPRATKLCLHCQGAIETYKQFTCVRQLAVSLQDIQALIENELEDVLSRVPLHFDSNKYKLVQEAYTILGQTQKATETLLMKFTSTIHDAPYRVVFNYVKAGSPADVKMPFASLCKEVDPDRFIDCLLEQCHLFWAIMYNYNTVRQWHFDDNSGAPPTVDGEELNERMAAADIAFHRNYIRQKLDSGLVKIWRDVQQKVRPYLEGCDMSQFQYDNFIKVLNIVNKLIDIGIEFCGEGSDKLQEAMRNQSLSYFRYYHRARLDELKLFLENEQWVMCPIRSNFTVDILREFRFMRRGLATPTNSVAKKTSQNLFGQFTIDENPFKEIFDDEDTEEVVMDTRGFEDTASDDEDKGTAGHRRAEGGHSSPGPKYTRTRSESSKGPVLANVTLTVVRFCGNYMQMMNVLQPIAYDVIQCLTNLFDYYLYAVYTFFAKDMIVGDEFQLSAKLSTSLTRISNTLLSSQSTPTSPDDSVKIPHPVPNPFLQLDNVASLYGLSFRIVAIESLVFLANQLEYLLPYLERLIPESRRYFLTQFFSQTVTPCNQLRVPVYNAIVSKSISTDQILQSMSQVKWDIKEIMSENSRYVNTLILELRRFKDMINGIERHIHIPGESTNILWNRAILTASQMFVEGFSQAKKCTNEGRALMQLDYQHFRNAVEQLSDMRPLPHHNYVEGYIKAYYISEDDLENWLQQHTEYTTKQLQALVLCGAAVHLNRKSKQRLLSLLDK